MKKWDKSEMSLAVNEWLQRYDALRINVSELFLGTTDEHVLELIGDSDAKKKAKTAALMEIYLDEDKEGYTYFTITKVDIIYGGSIIERDSFYIEDELDDESYNVAYANAIDDFTEEARHYNRNMKEQDAYGFYKRAFVVFEKDNNLRPVVKWIEVEHIYYENTPNLSYTKEEIRNIKHVKCNLNSRKFDETDIYEMTMFRWKTYDFPEHFTMVHVKADIEYDVYNEGEKHIQLQKIFMDFGKFAEEIYYLDKKIKHSNLKNRWFEVAGMDIDKMNELSESLLVEHYLKYGLKYFNDEYIRKQCTEQISYRDFLNRQTTFEDYLNVLNHLMVGSDLEQLKDKFFKLKGIDNVNEEDMFGQFIDEYLGDSLELGKIYFVEVNKEHYEVDKDTDVSEVEFLNSGIYLDLKQKVLNKKNFNYVILQDLPMNSKRSGKMLYLLDNVYEKDGKKYIHGWVGDILPVRVIGFHKDGTPITQYAKEWFSV